MNRKKKYSNWFTTEEITHLFPGISKQRLYQLRESYASGSGRVAGKIEIDDDLRLIHGSDFVRLSYRNILYSPEGVKKMTNRVGYLYRNKRLAT